PSPRTPGKPFSTKIHEGPNFFELAVAVAITIFGASSPVVLVTIVGVLVEVPVMLALVRIANRTKHWFPERKNEEQPE
ncbi:MAG: hypothetical protein JJU00_17270, partial [Opitutales bacterium]|nr:hypothetical protein [Opitutales bacterium]